IPCLPSGSSLLPTWYQTCTETTGVEWSSSTITFRPLARTARVGAGRLTFTSAGGAWAGGGAAARASIGRAYYHPPRASPRDRGSADASVDRASAVHPRARSGTRAG